jgi:formylmethanofuran dehydrogenase subunit B
MEAPTAITGVVCPFCSLACDDLAVEIGSAALRLTGPPCPIAEQEFARPPAPIGASIRGEPAGIDEAIAHAAELLARSALPLFGGLGTDVAGMRAVLALAERTGGIVDHSGSRGLLANLRAMQDGGWVTATLAEIRNRADVVLFVGTDTQTVAPRFVERCLEPRNTLFGPLQRELIYLGEGLATVSGAQSLPCPADRLAEVAGALRALVAGHRVTTTQVAGLPIAELQHVADRLQAARYAVVIWAAPELPGSQPDLLTGTLAGLTRELNVKGRCAGLPLAGANNIIGVNQVCAWQTGVPLRTSFASGAPDHDPVRWDTAKLLAADGVDCLVWLASLREQELPGTAAPTIALHGAGQTLSGAMEVAIAVGTPGLDHGGSIYRSDGVVSLPLRRLRDAGLSSAADILQRIGQHRALRGTT